MNVSTTYLRIVKKYFIHIVCGSSDSCCRNFNLLPHMRLNPVSGKKKIKKIFLSSTSSSCVSCMYISFMPFMYELITFHIIICIKAHTERYTDATISILNLYAKTNGEIMLNGREVNFFIYFMSL